MNSRARRSPLAFRVMRGASGTIARSCAFGSEAFRERIGEMVSALVMQKKRASYAGVELRFHDEQAAQKLLRSGLQALAMTLPDARQLRQIDRRKQELAWLFNTDDCRR